MATTLTITEAFDTWEALMSPDQTEAPEALQAEDGPLLEACEKIILTNDILDHRHAARLCAVIGESMQGGGRTDGLDLSALARLELWLNARHAVMDRSAEAMQSRRV